MRVQLRQLASLQAQYAPQRSHYSEEDGDDDGGDSRVPGFEQEDREFEEHQREAQVCLVYLYKSYIIYNTILLRLT